MKIFEKRHIQNLAGHWVEYYIFGKRVYIKRVCLYRYSRYI